MTFLEFQDRVHSLLGTHQEDPDSIFLGAGYAKDFPESFAVMEAWTSYIDKKIDENQDEKVKQLLSIIRLCNYNEFLKLFHHVPPRELKPIRGYKRDRVVDGLLIYTKERHEFFKELFTPDEKGFESFLAQYYEIPMAKYFFMPIRILIKRKPDLMQNTYVSGATGVGKSELLKTLFYQIAKKKEGSIVVLDPHGDLSEELISLQVTYRQRKRLLYIDPFLSRKKVCTINPFQTSDTSEENIDVLSQELVSVFKELIPSSLSLQMEAILTPCISVLLRKENGSLSELQRFMDDERNADLIALGLHSPNPAHAEFFRSAFKKREYSITKQSVYTRIQSLLNHKVFYNLINGNSTINLKRAVDNEKIIILNLSQGKLGTEMSAVFGKFIIAQLTSIALKRAHKPKFLRTPTFLIIDEFHNYVTHSIEKILAETRKYGLHLITANQNLAQIQNTRIKEVVLSNSRNKFVGSNSMSTLSVLAREIGVKADKLQELQKFQFYVKIGDRKAFFLKTINTLSKRAYQISDEERKTLREEIVHSSQYRDKDERSIADITDAPEEWQEKQKEEQNTISKKTTSPEPENPQALKPKFGFTKKDPTDE